MSIRKQALILMVFIVALGILNIQQVYAETVILGSQTNEIQNATSISYSGSITTPTNIFDDSTGTSGTFTTNNDLMYFNYSEPYSLAYWSLYYGEESQVWNNLSVTSPCISQAQTDNVLQLRLRLEAGEGSILHFECFSGSWSSMGTTSSTFTIFEEKAFIDEVLTTECDYLISENVSTLINTSSLGVSFTYVQENALFDDNDSTWLQVYNNSDAGEQYQLEYFFNWSKPLNVTNNTLANYFEIKWSDLNTTNYTIPLSCLNAHNDTVQMRLEFLNNTDNNAVQFWINCYPEWTPFSQSLNQERLFGSTTHKLYETRFYWCNSSLEAIEPEPNITLALNGTYHRYSCIDDYSVKNITTIINGNTTNTTLEFTLCDNGCNEDNLIITMFGNEPSLCNPEEWLSILMFIAFAIIIIKLIQRLS